MDHSRQRTNPADPKTIRKFVNRLPIPRQALPINYDTCKGKWPKRPFYRIYMRENYHRFHKDFPLTKIWGYNGKYPGPIIEAEKDVPIRIQWINQLPDKHILPVDRSLHGCGDSPDNCAVVHLHGANVASSSDGHPDAWFTPGYRNVGPSFSRKIYEYPNHQPGATLWYHDHVGGMTRLNVYAGLLGLYILRDPLEKRLNLPQGDYEIPLIIQDKQFNEDGSLFYPDNATPPVDKPTPSTPSFFFGNTVVVNGKIWPYLNVEPRKYRFRILNGSNTRAYTLSLSNGGSFIQIGTDLGLLRHPMELSTFTLEPAERIDVIIDFSKYKEQEIILNNSAGGLDPDEDMSDIMKFRVVLPLKGKDTSEVPEDLSFYHSVNPNLAVRERTMHLVESTDDFGRVIHLLNGRRWHDPVTEIVKKDTIEIWHLVNHFDFPHPIHLHLVHFEILGRKPFTAEDFDDQGNYIYNPDQLTPPLPYEQGLKDTVSAFPGEVTTIAVHFKNHIGHYVWHCHILEHEDNDMMRPLKVVE